MTTYETSKNNLYDNNPLPNDQPDEKKSFVSNLTTNFISIIGILCFILLVISFYTVLLCNFIFFVTSFISYFISPILNGFISSWFDLFVSSCRIILSCPFIQFYIIFIMKSVLSVVELFGLFPKLATNLLNFIKKDHSLEINNCLLIFLMNFAFLVLLGVLIGIFVSSFYFPHLFLIPGIILYLKIVIQIFLLMLSVYVKWFNIIFHTKFDDKRFYNYYSRGKKFFFTGEPDKSPNDQKKSILLEDNPSAAQSQTEESQPKTVEPQPQTVEPQSKTEEHNFKEFFEQFSKCFDGTEYEFIYKYADDIYIDSEHVIRNKIILIILTLLNLVVIVFDFVKAFQYQSQNLDLSYFLGSVILRLFFLPLTSYYNFIYSLFNFNKLDDFIHKLILLLIPVAAILLLLISLIAYPIIITYYKSTFRISNLPSPSMNISYESHYPECKICKPVYQNYTLLDLIGFSLGPYDFFNQPVFINQSQYFFGDKFNQSFITYNPKTIDILNYTYIIYDDTETNTTIFGFKGFDSPAEIAVHLQMLVDYTFKPFFYDLCPLFETILNDWLKLDLDWISKLALNFFDPLPLVNQFINPIQDVYEINYSNSKNVVFTGLNIGGLFAKVLGMKNNRAAVSFFSYPVFTEIIQSFFDFSMENSLNITNVYNMEGSGSVEEHDIISNIGIPVLDTSSNFNKEGVYQSLCTIASICRTQPIYNEYCKHALNSPDQWEEIVKAVDELP